MFELHRSSPVSLPRLSPAGLMLAFVLSTVVATFVGVAAWSLASGSGISSADAAAMRSSAYSRGLSVGLAKGHVQSVKARKLGYAAGRRHGYRAGLRRGRNAGLRAGRLAGYTSGYAQGLSQGRAEGAAAASAKKTTKSH